MRPNNYTFNKANIPKQKHIYEKAHLLFQTLPNSSMELLLNPMKQYFIQ